MTKGRKCEVCQFGTANKKVVCIDCHLRAVGILASKVEELEGKVMTQRNANELLKLFVQHPCKCKSQPPVLPKSGTA